MNKSDLKSIGKHADQDTQIAAGLATAGLLSDEGLQSMAQVLKGANDPTQALAHVVFMALGKVREKLQQKGIEIDDKVWIAGGGVLDRVLFEVMTALVGILGYKQAGDATFVHNVKEAVLDLMNQEEEQPEQGQPPDDEQQQGGIAAPQPQMGAPAPTGANS